MKNKKGFLLAEETLKTVLAVIAIGFLIYFLVSLYFVNLKEGKQKQAEATLEKISKIIKSAETYGEIRAITPEKWYLFSFTKEIKPNSCAGKNCVCICQLKVDVVFNLPLTFEQRQANECSDDGRCLIVENLENFERIGIEDIADSPTNINVSKIDNKIVIKKIP